MKTKMRVLKNTNDKSTKTIISIPPCAATSILKSLHSNKISCDYMGLDQSGRILMQITYEKDYDTFIKEINTYIETSEEMLNEINKVLNEIIQKKNDEMNKEIDELLKRNKKKREERTKASTTV